MLLQEDLNRRLQAQELLGQRRLLAAMHWARATLRWRGVLPWKAAVSARTGALRARWRTRLLRLLMSSGRRLSATTRALVAAAHGVAWQRARALHGVQLLGGVWRRWQQQHKRVQGARLLLGKTAAQAPLRLAVGLWQHHAGVAREVREARELRLAAQADGVYVRSARRRFMRLWEEAASLLRADGRRQKMRQDLKGKVSAWISEYRHQQEGGEGRMRGGAEGHEGVGARNSGALRGEVAAAASSLLHSPSPPRGAAPTPHTRVSPGSPTQQLIRKFRSQRLGACADGILNAGAGAACEESPEHGVDPLAPVRADGDAGVGDGGSAGSPRTACTAALSDSPTRKLITQLRCKRSLMAADGFREGGERGAVGVGVGVGVGVAAEQEDELAHVTVQAEDNGDLAPPGTRVRYFVG